MKPHTVFSLFWGEVKKQPWWLSLILVSAVALETAQLLQPLFFKDFINLLTSAGDTRNFEDLFVVLALIVSVYVGNFFANRLRMWGLVEFEAKIKRDLYSVAFDNTLRHSFDFFANQFSGTLTRRISRLHQTFEMLFDSYVMTFGPAAFIIIGSISLLYLQHFYLGIALTVWVLVFIVLQVHLALSQSENRKERSRADTALSGGIADAISNQQSVLFFSQHQFESNRVKELAQKWYTTNITVWRSTERLWFILGGLQLIIQIVMLFLSAYLWSIGKITVGDIVLVQSFLLLIFNQLGQLHNRIKGYFDSLADAEEMIEILNTPYGVTDVRDAKDLVVRKGEVVFKEVEFKYEKGETIFNGLNLTIAPHEKVALVGTSGAGKSTVTKLLMRLYDVTKGEIRIDGQEVKSVTQTSVRNALAFVPQDPILFHRSLLENIRYGRLSATDEEVYEASRKAQCHDFIMRAPSGYDTLVGERGIKLSGGERQRIAIARAILKDAPILILDEATSALDSESEHLIQSALKELMQGKTVIAIAHRLSTIMNMDRIIVIENGTVTLTGTHEELMNHSGNIYKKLFEIQSGGFITDDTK